MGDALYVQAIARHLVNRGERLRVCTAWPDVFRPLGNKVEIEGFRRTNIQVLAHYSIRKRFPDTTQFQDCCITAGIQEPVELKLDWTVRNRALVDSLQKPFVCVQLPRNPMGRTDGFGKELLPDCRKIQVAIDAVKSKVVQIGSGEPLYRFTGIDVDLAGKTSVSDMLDVASAASGFIGYPSFILPLAESFGKPVMVVFARRGLNSRTPYVAQITPKKLLHGPASKYVVDDDSDEKIMESMNAFC